MPKQFQQSTIQNQSFDSLTRKSKLPQLIRDFSYISQREAQWPNTKSSYLTPPPTPRRSPLNHHYLSHKQNPSVKCSKSVDYHSSDESKVNHYSGGYNTPSAECSQRSHVSHSVHPSQLNNGCSSQSDSRSRSSSLPKFNDSKLTPEIIFLINEQAKTSLEIDKMSVRLKQLEAKVDNICKRIEKSKCSSPGSVDKEREICGAENILSDDSGGEYSRTTTGTVTDEDELLSLLDQIAKCSIQIKQTKQAENCQNQFLSDSLCKASSQPSPAILNDCRYPTGAPTLPNTSFKQQSLSALIFEPNSCRFLDEVHQLMDDKNHPLSMSGYTSQPFVSQSLPISSDEDNLRFQINKAKNIINQRHESGIESQSVLADKWFFNHLYETQKQAQSHHQSNQVRSTQGS